MTPKITTTITPGGHAWLVIEGRAPFWLGCGDEAIITVSDARSALADLEIQLCTKRDDERQVRP